MAIKEIHTIIHPLGRRIKLNRRVGAEIYYSYLEEEDLFSEIHERLSKRGFRPIEAVIGDRPLGESLGVRNLLGTYLGVHDAIISSMTDIQYLADFPRSTYRMLIKHTHNLESPPNWLYQVAIQYAPPDNNTNHYINLGFQVYPFS